MRQLSEVQKQELARTIRKNYMQLLTDQAKRAALKVDSFFFLTEEEQEESGVDDSSVRPYFYGGLFALIFIGIFILLMVSM